MQARIFAFFHPVHLVPRSTTHLPFEKILQMSRPSQDHNLLSRPSWVRNDDSVLRNKESVICALKLICWRCFLLCICFLIGTGLGILLSSTLGSDWLALTPIFACLSTINLSCNYISLRHVSLNTVNSEVGDAPKMLWQTPKIDLPKTTTSSLSIHFSAEIGLDL